MDVLQQLKIARQAQTTESELGRLADILRGRQPDRFSEFAELLKGAREATNWRPSLTHVQRTWELEAPLRELRDWAADLLAAAPAVLDGEEWLRALLTLEIGLRRPLHELAQNPGGATRTVWYRHALRALLGRDDEVDMDEYAKVIAEAAARYLAMLGATTPASEPSAAVTCVLGAWAPLQEQLDREWEIVVFDPAWRTSESDDLVELCEWAFPWVSKLAGDGALALGASRFGAAVLPGALVQGLIPREQRASTPAKPGEDTSEFLEALSAELRAASNDFQTMMPSLRDLNDPFFADPLLARVSRVRARGNRLTPASGWAVQGQQVEMAVTLTGTIIDPEAFRLLVDMAGDRLAHERLTSIGPGSPDHEIDPTREESMRHLIERTIESPSLAGLSPLRLIARSAHVAPPGEGR